MRPPELVEVVIGGGGQPQTQTSPSSDFPAKQKMFDELQCRGKPGCGRKSDRKIIGMERPEPEQGARGSGAPLAAMA